MTTLMLLICNYDLDWREHRQGHNRTTYCNAEWWDKRHSVMLSL